ncbi:hypothetical protein [Spongiactinospora gelatinilytica]|uniref:hypothetical protein n=1 Tax=Spongiactinospora gelatinilytica TaxID=2666298 RepID=UPI0018F5F913|nr:hypothetical protein [Spongiactinospora gelatinilytica]
MRRGSTTSPDLFEQAVAGGTPIRQITGENPLEFVEEFVKNYTEGGYVPARARKRLTDAITRATGQGDNTA